MRGKKQISAPQPSGLLTPVAKKRAATVFIEDSEDDDSDTPLNVAIAASRAPKKAKSAGGARAIAMGDLSAHGDQQSRPPTPAPAIPARQPSQQVGEAGGQGTRGQGAPGSADAYPVTRRLLEQPSRNYNEDWQTYTPPPAPPLPSAEDMGLTNVAEDMLMTPRASHAYQLGDSNKYVVLAGYGNGMNIQIREFRRGNHTTLHPDNRRLIKMDAVIAANLLHLSQEVRNVMFDDGPAVGEMRNHIGRLIYLTLNPEYGPALDIRHFFYPKDPHSPELPTRRGIRLSKEEFDVALIALTAMKEHWPAFQQAESCIAEHVTQEAQGAEENCPYCTPPRV